MAANVNGEGGLPASNSEASRLLPDAVIPDDQPGGSKLQERRVVEIQRRLDKLTIPTTCSSPCESNFSPISAVMHDARSSLLQARNVIVFGESGVGKSSVINMVAGDHITRTSNDAVGCTFQYQCYQVLLGNFYVNFWDTVGLDEGTEGTVPAKQAENSLKTFLHQITRWNGIDLLLYCVRGTRVRQALLRNYDIFYSAICRKKVPVALVVTGLENYEGEMEAWWTEHEKDLIKHGMRFDAHACVTTIQSDHPAIQNRLKHSQCVLRNLVQTTFETWRADEDSLMSASLPDACALLRTAERRATPLIMIYDALKQENRDNLSPTTAGSRLTFISDRKYKCLYVDTEEVLLGDSKRCAETVQRPDLLIFCADADSELVQMWDAFEQFHILFGGEMCPVIIVFRGLDDHEAAVKMWRRLSSLHGGEIIANPTYYPCSDSPREMVARADEALAALVDEKCLIRFEEKLTRFQKFCRQTSSRFLFAGRF